jgi:hypothetical protein
MFTVDVLTLDQLLKFVLHVNFSLMSVYFAQRRRVVIRVYFHKFDPVGSAPEIGGKYQ